LLKKDNHTPFRKSRFGFSSIPILVHKHFYKATHDYSIKIDLQLTNQNQLHGILVLLEEEEEEEEEGWLG
jgi:hypothetical protein